MAGSVNKVILVGNLGKDPEIRNTQSGSKIVNMNIATSDVWNDKQSGERKERTEWHRIVIFNEHLASVAERFVKKGSKVYIEGELRTRKWTDQSGQERYTTEVVIDRYRGDLTLLDSKAASGNGSSGNGNQQQQHNPPQQQQQQQKQQNESNGWGGWGGNDLDDEIPF